MELIERIIKASSNKGDIILDPFMGSGSTAECALKNERLVIGFEIETKYIHYTQQRIDNYLLNQKTTILQSELNLLV